MAVLWHTRAAFNQCSQEGTVLKGQYRGHIAVPVRAVLLHSSYLSIALDLRQYQQCWNPTAMHTVRSEGTEVPTIAIAA